MSLGKRFFKFVIPSIVSMWVFSMYTMVDGIFVSWGVGEHALSAVNLSMPYTSVVFTLGILFATGTSTVISIALGQKDLEKARGFFSQNLVVVIIVSLVMSVVTLLNLERVALFLGATPSTLQYVKEYVGVIAVFFVFFTVAYNLEVQVKANGAPHISTIGVISCALMNVVLDYFFVMHFGWGVWGAAVATGLAQVTATVVFLVYFAKHKQRLRIVKFKWNLGAYRRILPLGLSDGLNELSNGLVIFFFNMMILRVIGEHAIASYTIISYVNTLVLMTMTGTAQGIQPLVSYHLGAGERHICHRLLAYGTGLVAIFSLVSLALGRFGAQAAVGLFLDPARVPELFAYSITALQRYSWCFLILGFNVILAGYFTAVERPKFSFTISIARSFVLLVASLFFLSSVFGEAGLWYSTLLSEGLCLFISGFFFLRYVRGERGIARRAAKHTAQELEGYDPRTDENVALDSALPIKE